MMSHARRFIANSAGVAAIEYALILAGIGIAFTAGLELVSALSSVLFANVTATLGPVSGH